MKYFKDIPAFGLEATCSSCGVLTLFTGRNRYRIEENGVNLAKYRYQFQCQDCGKLGLGDFDKRFEIALEKRCECGGQYRRDKPLFCSSCKVNKTSENVSS